jgi:hypothetical protein
MDINGDAAYGKSGPNGILANFAGYDYVLDLNVAATDGVYDVIKLVSVSTVLADVLENYHSPESRPWKYVSGGIGFDEDLALIYGLTAFSSASAFFSMISYGINPQTLYEPTPCLLQAQGHWHSENLCFTCLPSLRAGDIQEVFLFNNTVNQVISDCLYQKWSQVM